MISPSTIVDLSSMTSRLIEDWYLDGARLRLRQESVGDEEPTVWKLCKKYGRAEDYRQPMVNIYLDEAEHALLRRCRGWAIAKRRYGLTTEAPFKIDVFEGELTGHRSCEFELEDWRAVAAFEPPSWVGPEITEDARFSGGFLSRTSFTDLEPSIREILDEGST